MNAEAEKPRPSGRGAVTWDSFTSAAGLAANREADARRIAGPYINPRAG